MRFDLGRWREFGLGLIVGLSVSVAVLVWQNYRAKQEAERWIQTRDPLEGFERRATEAGLVTSAELRALDKAVEDELAAAVAAAEAAPLPDPAEVTRDVYVGGAA